MQYRQLPRGSGEQELYRLSCSTLWNSASSEELGQSKIALYAFPTKSWCSLLALSTQIPGVFTGGVVFLCHVLLQGPVDTQGQVLHWADLRLLQLLRWRIEPVLNPATLFRERSANQGGGETQIFKNYQSHFPPLQLSSVNNSPTIQ